MQCRPCISLGAEALGGRGIEKSGLGALGSYESLIPATSV